MLDITVGVISALATAAATRGQPSEGVRFRVDYDAAALAEICRPGGTGSQQELKNLLCAGYVIGIRDALFYNTDMINNLVSDEDHLSDPFCPPAGTMRGQYIDAFNDYMEQHPEMGNAPAAGIVLKSFEFRFPCSRGSK